MERQRDRRMNFSRRLWKEPASLCDIYAGPGIKVPDQKKLSFVD
jgi:hypothetical protein